MDPITLAVLGITTLSSFVAGRYYESYSVPANNTLTAAEDNDSNITPLIPMCPFDEKTIQNMMTSRLHSKVGNISNETLTSVVLKNPYILPFVKEQCSTWTPEEIKSFKLLTIVETIQNLGIPKLRPVPVIQKDYSHLFVNRQVPLEWSKYKLKSLDSRKE